MPRELWGIFKRNRHLLHDLPVLGAEVIQQWINMKCGVTVLIIVVQHTFGGDLKFNTHLHILISAGGLSKSAGRWIPRIELHKNALMRMWRYAVITHVRGALKAIANGITSEITTSKTGFDATMKRSDTILNGVDDNIKIANGGDSYAYVVMSPVNGGFDVYVTQDGNYHLLDAVVSVIDLDKFEAAVKAGQIFDRRRYEVVNTSVPLLYRGRALVVGTLPLDGGDYKRYNSTIFARNGIFSELSRLMRVGDTWKSAFVVSVSYYNGKKGIACEKIDKEFPHELQNEQ